MNSNNDVFSNMVRGLRLSKINNMPPPPQPVHFNPLCLIKLTQPKIKLKSIFKHKSVFSVYQ